MFKRRVIETLALGALLALVTAPVAYKTIAQSLTPVGVMGLVSPGVYQQLKTDATGNLYVSGAGSGGATSVVQVAYPSVLVSPVQSITVSTVAITAVPANSNRKAICLQMTNDNNVGVFFQFSTVITASAGGMLISGVGNSYCQYNFVSTAAISMSATASTTAVRVVEYY